ncbi:T9SS type A sorting domain-containing protein [bacterium]|nr:T9SS type A sorting domain-containing protein [bacterium]
MKSLLFRIILVYFVFAIIINAADDWTQESATGPAERQFTAMAYVGNGEALLFGGYDGSSVIYDDTWIYDISANTWEQKNPSSKPSARAIYGIAYIGSNQIILFGGSNSNENNNETWVYDHSANSWTQTSPSNPPLSRHDHPLAYIGGDQVLLFGGDTSGAGIDDTWIYDLSSTTWTQKNPSPKPSARFQHDLAYIGDDKVLLFGGDDGMKKNDTWIYDLGDNTWTEMDTTGKTLPPIRFGHRMVYIGGDKVLLFGGNDGSSYKNDTWIYDLSENTWTEDSNTIQPTGRKSFAFSETSMNGESKPVLFSGDIANTADTWTYGGGDYSLPVELIFFSAIVEYNSVLLSWETASEIENLGFNLYRKENDGQYIQLAGFNTYEQLKGYGSTSETHHYTYTDHKVQAGVKYNYMLADVRYNLIERKHPELDKTVSIPENMLKNAHSYVLGKAYPNPFNPKTVLSLVLKQEAYVSAKLYDLSGRKVKNIVSSEYSTGTYSIVIDSSSLSSGIYLLRVTVNYSASVQKVILLK